MRLWTRKQKPVEPEDPRDAGFDAGCTPGATKNVPMAYGHDYAMAYLEALILREALTPRPRSKRS